MAEPKYSRICDRVRETLSECPVIRMKSEIPSEMLTGGKTYDVRRGAIFATIRNQNEHISDSNKHRLVSVAKTFDGTMLYLMRSRMCVESGVRGNSVYGIFSMEDRFSLTEMYGIVAEMNSAVALLNRLYAEKNMDQISVGIGMSQSRGLVTRVRNGSQGGKDRIWIAEAITEAEGLSMIGSRDENGGSYGPVAMPTSVYCSLRSLGGNPSVNVAGEFRTEKGFVHGCPYSEKFDRWIGSEMKG